MDFPSLVAMIIGAWLVAFSSPAHAQSLYRLFDDRIIISPASGQAGLASYLLRFGIFINNFTPTVANFAQWDANFRGSTGAIDGAMGGPFGASPGSYAAEFSASNNLLYPEGSQLYLVAYNVAPNAAVATATQGVILTRNDWILSGPSTVTSGRRTTWVQYYYEVGGAWTALGDMAETNVAPITSTSAFSSPVNPFSLGSDGSLQTSFDMVPEPGSVSLLVFGIAGMFLLNRRRILTKSS